MEIRGPNALRNPENRLPVQNTTFECKTTRVSSARVVKNSWPKTALASETASQPFLVNSRQEAEAPLAFSSGGISPLTTPSRACRSASPPFSYCPASSFSLKHRISS
jgi:hypothetical protein